MSLVKPGVVEPTSLREAIESIVADYCDGTLDGFEFSLQHARFVEWFGENSNRGPQELVDRIVTVVEKYKEMWVENAKAVLP